MSILIIKYLEMMLLVIGVVFVHSLKIQSQKAQKVSRDYVIREDSRVDDSALVNVLWRKTYNL